MYKVARLCIPLFLASAVSLFAQQLDASVATVKLTTTQPALLSSLQRDLAVYEHASNQQGRAFGDAERTAVLYRMIDVLLFRQAAARDHVAVTDAQMNASLEQARLSLSSQQGRQLTLDDLKAYVIATGQSWEWWLQSQRDQVLVQLYVTQVKAKELQAAFIPPTDTDIEYSYQTNLQQFAMGEIVEFKQVFVSTPGKDAAGQADAKIRIESCLQQMNKGESFEDLAAAVSEDAASKGQGGYVGFLRLDQPQAKALGKDFVLSVMDLKDGQTSGVIRSTLGYHIVKMVRVIPAKLYSLTDKTPPYYQQTVADTIRANLVALGQQQAFASTIEATTQELRRQSEVRIEGKNLGFKLTQKY